MKKCKPQKNGHQQCDNFHAQVEQSIQHLENSMFTNFQGHSTHNCVYYLKSMPTPQSLDRSCRKIGLSCHQIYQAGWRSTFAGRHKLWSWIEKYQPEHIWMAPECGPCGGWNRLNKLKSAMMFDEFKLNRTNLDASRPFQMRSPEFAHWRKVFELALSIAPRVGKARCLADSEMWQKAQELVGNHMQISDMFVCTGTERFQVPLQAPSSHQLP